MTRKTTIQRLQKPSSTRRKFVPPTVNEIAFCAYAIYAKENPERATELWREAEAQLMADRQHDAGLFPGSRILSRN